jgi:uncharacterized membrane protein
LPLNSHRQPAGFRAIAALRRVPRPLRLGFSVAIGGVVFLLAPKSFAYGERLALSWIIGVGIFLGLVAAIVTGVTPERLRRRARDLDPRGSVITVIIVAGATASLFALGFTLQKPPNESAAAMFWRLGLAGVTVAASWAVTHTTMALHYAHHFYGDGPAPGPQDDRGGLAFPGNDEPDYWDFLYFSFVIGMTCQVSDVQVTSRAMRRLTLVHGVLSFLFNTVILALAVNLLASAL